MAQLMVLFMLSELHCVDELFMMVQILSAKLSVDGGLRIEHSSASSQCIETPVAGAAHFSAPCEALSSHKVHAA